MHQVLHTLDLPDKIFRYFEQILLLNIWLKKKKSTRLELIVLLYGPFLPSSLFVMFEMAIIVILALLPKFGRRTVNSGFPGLLAWSEEGCLT